MALDTHDTLPPGVSLRGAVEADIDALTQLDERCFPQGSSSREHAAPGEFAYGISAGWVSVLAAEDQIIGFIQLDRPSPDHLFIASLAVDPDQRGRGHGGRLLRYALASIPDDESQRINVATVTAPDNRAMLHLLLQHGFEATDLLDHYYGADHPRLFLHRPRRPHRDQAAVRLLVPAAGLDQVRTLLGRDDQTVTGLLPGAAGDLFEVSRRHPSDSLGLRSSEAGAGIAFSTAMLAGLTFLLAFAFGGKNYPVGALVLLTLATGATLLSLIVYANSTGDLARLHPGTFEHNMKWGNLFSEFGGVYPFVLSLVVTFSAVIGSRPAAIAIGVAASCAQVGYERSSFALAGRYRRTALTRALALGTALLPALSEPSLRRGSFGWSWTMAAVVLLTLRIAVLGHGNTTEGAEPDEPSGSS